MILNWSVRFLRFLSQQVYLYRYSEVDGQPELDNIQDDDEYEAAADAFDEFLDGQEYDELVSEEDLDDL